MPRYVYRCGQCQHSSEIVQSFRDPALKVCPDCHAPSLHRVPQAVPFVLKGGAAARFVGGKQVLNGEYTVRDGGEDVTYGSVQDAVYGERDRYDSSTMRKGLHEKIIRKNIAHLRKTGYIPGTPEAVAMDELPVKGAGLYASREASP